MTRAAAAAAVTLAMLAATPASGATPPRASLALGSIAPLTVFGRSFGPGESVLLTFAGADGAIRGVRVSSTRQGRFRASFRFRLDRCDSFTVRAAGRAGSRAVLQVERRCETDDAKAPPKRPPREPAPSKPPPKKG